MVFIGVPCMERFYIFPNDQGFRNSYDFSAMCFKLGMTIAEILYKMCFSFLSYAVEIIVWFQVSDDECRVPVPDLHNGMAKAVSLPLIQESSASRTQHWAITNYHKSSQFHPFSDTDITPLVRWALRRMILSSLFIGGHISFYLIYCAVVNSELW